MNAVLKQELSPLRVGRITGSRVGAILGVNPYSTRADVLREMVREYHGAEREFQGNDATRYGEEMEPSVLAAYERQQGCMSYGGGDCIVHPKYDFLAVTPDGLVGDEGMVECKAPYRGTYTHWQEKQYYEAQMRLQLACAGRAWCDFAVLHRDGTLHVSRLEHEPEWLVGVLPSLEAFMAEYQEAIANPEPYIGERVAVMDTDFRWRAAAKEYRLAAQQMELAKAAEAEARRKLLELAESAGSKTVKGCGVQVIRSERAGSIAYAKAIKDLLPDADLSPYTGKPSTVFTVKECKA